MLDAATIDDVSTMRELIRAAFWGVAYHERELPIAHRKLALLIALLERAGLPTDLKLAKEIAGDGEEEDANNVREWAAWLLVNAADSVEYHETELRKDHKKLAAAKTLMLRAGIDLPLADIEADQRKSANTDA